MRYRQHDMPAYLSCQGLQKEPSTTLVSPLKVRVQLNQHEAMHVMQRDRVTTEGVID